MLQQAAVAGDRARYPYLASVPERKWFGDWLQRRNRDATGYDSRLEWIVLLDEPASIDRGEITYKGSINQSALTR